MNISGMGVFARKKISESEIIHSLRTFDKCSMVISVILLNYFVYVYVQYNTKYTYSTLCV